MQKDFKYGSFKDLNLEDTFFDSLRLDYPNFNNWFIKKSELNTSVYYYKDDDGKILAMLYLKYENDTIDLKDRIIEPEQRIKIGTLKLSENIRDQRIGEGAIGLLLWDWRNSCCNQIYVTVFDKHQALISLFLKFGFSKLGKKDNGELVFIKDKKTIQYTNPFVSFPYINPKFESFGMIPIYEEYHDILFPYSKLQRNFDDSIRLAASNGITKTFIGFPYTDPHFTVGLPIFIYRISSKTPKTYNSVITSVCTITKVEWFYKNSNSTFDNFNTLVKNRTAFSQKELLDIYNKKNNFIIIDFVYNYYFGSGNNVNHNYLDSNNLFNGHPYLVRYNSDEVKSILKKGKVNVQDVIID
jgi:L-amino acid N-acyltransferase YncA